MKYLGSKNRLSKYLVPIIQNYIDENNIEIYIEPFVGGANMIDKIKCNKKIGYDIHKELIALLNAIKDGWQPPSHISEEEYNNVKNNKKNYTDYYIGFVGFNATFGAKYFGGYARDRQGDRDIPNEAFRNLMKQAPNLQDIEFINQDYSELSNIHNAVIYCDPPYANTTKYSIKNFNHDIFWQWCRDMSKNNIVIVSEYTAPDDFKCIWEKEHKANFDSNRNKDSEKTRIEKLFIYGENNVRKE